MKHMFGLFLGALLPSVGNAQDFTTHEGFVLQAEADTWREKGAARPTVTFDADAGQYVMYHTSQYPDWYAEEQSDDFSGCKNGIFGVGRAVSPDGINWTPEPADGPVLGPKEGTFGACAVAHPTVILDNGTWRLWFKTEQEADPCPDGETPAWGCERFTGIGYAESTDGINWTMGAEPILANTAWGPSLGIGFPSVVRLEDKWVLYASSIPNIYMATSEQPGSGWVAEPTEVDSETGEVTVLPLLKPGANAWMADRVFCPALSCDELNTSLPIQFWFGGKDLDGTWGFGKASAGGPPESEGDEVEVFVSSSSPFREWEATEAANRWGNFDVLRIGEDDWVVYYKAKDENNVNAIGMAYTVSSWSGEDMHDRICVTIVTDEDGDGVDGIVHGGTDCDDTDPDVFPGAVEIWYDGIDQDCDGNDQDQDQDGYDAEEVDGDDCDDEDPDVNPGVSDPFADGVDRNCDGVDGPLDSGDTGPGEPGGGEGCCKNKGSDGTAALFFLPLLLLRRKRR